MFCYFFIAITICLVSGRHLYDNQYNGLIGLKTISTWSREPITFERILSDGISRTKKTAYAANLMWQVNGTVRKSCFHEIPEL